METLSGLSDLFLHPKMPPITHIFHQGSTKKIIDGGYYCFETVFDKMPHVCIAGGCVKVHVPGERPMHFK